MVENIFLYQQKATSFISRKSIWNLWIQCVKNGSLLWDSEESKIILNGIKSDTRKRNQHKIVNRLVEKTRIEVKSASFNPQWISAAYAAASMPFFNWFSTALSLIRVRPHSQGRTFCSGYCFRASTALLSSTAILWRLFISTFHISVWVKEM